MPSGGVDIDAIGYAKYFDLGSEIPSFAGKGEDDTPDLAAASIDGIRRENERDRLVVDRSGRDAM